MNVIFEFLIELIFWNQSALHESCQKCPGSCEGIKDVNIRSVNGCSKLFLENVCNRIIDKVHYRDRRVDNAELIS